MALLDMQGMEPEGGDGGGGGGFGSFVSLALCDSAFSTVLCF